MRNWKAFVRAASAASVPLWAVGAHAQPGAASLAQSFGGEKHFSRPSRDSTMGFTFPAEILEIRVKGGDEVKKGDVLLKANASEQEYQRDLQKLLAETDLEIMRAQTALDQAQVEFDAQKKMKDDRGGSPVEFLRAEAQLAIRKVELDIAKFQQVQQRLNLAFRQAIVDRFSIRAPFDGRIDLVVADLGEVKKDGEPVVRVVDTDPLWIDVPANAAQTIMLKLKPGAPAWVLMDLPEEPRVYKGSVIEVSAEADARSNTRRVRVELPNPHDWPSGLTCWVRFTEPGGEWASKVVTNDGPAPEAGAVALEDAGAKK